jgi:hypothetical protein
MWLLVRCRPGFSKMTMGHMLCSASMYCERNICAIEMSVACVADLVEFAVVTLTETDILSQHWKAL